MALMIFASFFAYFVKGISGFANTLVFTSILSFQKSNKNISPLDLLLGIPSNIYFTIKERKNISLKIVIPLTLLVYTGIIPGTYFLKFGNEQTLKIIFGISLIILGAEMFLRERQKTKMKPNTFVLLAIGVISGILCGLFGVGAFLVAYISRTTENMNQFRGNVCCVFLAENIFRLIMYTATGIFTWEIIKLSIILTPITLIGLFAGIIFSKQLNEKTIKRIVVVLLIIMGISLILKNL